MQIERRYWRGDIDLVKTDRSNRELPLGRLDEFLRPFRPADESEFVFVIKTLHGSTRDDSVIRRHHLKPAARRVGIDRPGFGFHAFRREALTALSRTIDPIQALLMMGHTRPSVTMLYALSDRGRQEEGVRKFQDSILGKKGNDE